MGNLEVPKTIAGYCDIIDPGDESEVRRELGPVINDAAALDALIKCLQAVGVLSTSPPTALKHKEFTALLQVFKLYFFFVFFA